MTYLSFAHIFIVVSCGCKSVLPVVERGLQSSTHKMSLWVGLPSTQFPVHGRYPPNNPDLLTTQACNLLSWTWHHAITKAYRFWIGSTCIHTNTSVLWLLILNCLLQNMWLEVEKQLQISCSHIQDNVYVAMLLGLSEQTEVCISHWSGRPSFQTWI